MKTNWTLNEHSQGVLEVVVEGQAWEKAQKKAFNYFKKNINLKGFRPGQVPASIVKKYVKDEDVYSYAIREVGDDALQAGIEAHQLELVSQPLLDYKDASKEQITLVFACVVMPEVKLGDYKDLEVAKESAEVSEEEVEQALKQVQNRYADWVLKEEGTAELGDQVTIDFVGKKDGVEFEGGQGTDYPLELGSHTFIEGFEEQIVGMAKGETKDLDVTFPEGYQAADLAGQPAVFTVTVKEIRSKDAPAIDDELIKRLKREGIETVEAFKESERKRLEEQKERDVNTAFENALIAKVVENSEVEVPEVMVTNEAKNMLQDFKARLGQSGFTFDQYMSATHSSEEAMLDNFKPEALEHVKAGLVLNAIVKAENLEVSDEDVEAEFKSMSELYSMDVERLKQVLSVSSVKSDLSTRKALELIKASVKA